MGGNAQGEKKKGLLASGWLCTSGVRCAGVVISASGVDGEIGFRFRAFSARKAHLLAYRYKKDHQCAPPCLSVLCMCMLSATLMSHAMVCPARQAGAQLDGISRSMCPLLSNAQRWLIMCTTLESNTRYQLARMSCQQGTHLFAD